MTKTVTIRTYLRIRYHCDDLGVLGPRLHQLYTMEPIPRWVGAGNAPLTWEDEFVGEAEDLEVADYLAPLFSVHRNAAPPDCNHTSAMSHEMAADTLPVALRECLAVAQ